MRIAFTIAALAVLGLASPALADEDSDKAFEAVKRGDIAPLASVLATVEEMYGGRVLEVELEEEELDPEDMEDGAPADMGGPVEEPIDESQSANDTVPADPPKTAPLPFQPVKAPSEMVGRTMMYYEIKLLTDDGYILKLKFDARTADLLSVKGKDNVKREQDDDNNDNNDNLNSFKKWLPWGND